MIELDGLGSATESFSDETIMSPNQDSNFPRVSISNEVSNYNVHPQNLPLKICDKLEDNTEYLAKSTAFIGKLFHIFFEETIKCSKQKQICETKTQEIVVEKSKKIEKPHLPLGTYPINFINKVSNVSQNDTEKLLQQPFIWIQLMLFLVKGYTEHSDIITPTFKKYNPFCSLKFTMNFRNSRKQKSTQIYC